MLHDNNTVRGFTLKPLLLLVLAMLMSFACGSQSDLTEPGLEVSILVPKGLSLDAVPKGTELDFGVFLEGGKYKNLRDVSVYYRVKHESFQLVDHLREEMMMLTPAEVKDREEGWISLERKKVLTVQDNIEIEVRAVAYLGIKGLDDIKPGTRMHFEDGIDDWEAEELEVASVAKKYVIKVVNR